MMRKLDLIPLRYRRRLFGPPPVSARHVEWSAIASNDDELLQPTDDLIGIVLRAVERARGLRLDTVAERCSTALESSWVNHWPGDHYRLLAALVDVLGIGKAVEVGTFTGMGTLALAHSHATVRTFDVVPWADFPNTLLRSSDFEDRVEQVVGDLANSAFFESQVECLRSAGLIFIDGPKDSIFEPAFVSLLVPILRAGQVLVVDDIRKLEMLQLWRDLPLHKLDCTSFGHWSGTGLAIV